MEGKNIIICFDGTSNHPSDAKQEREWFGWGDIEDNGITNILKLHTMFGGNLTNEASSKKQHSLYYSGVGTYGNKIQQMFNAAFAPNNLDVARIIKTAGRDLRRIFREGDQIFLFGFSRGAALARRFAAVIDRYLPSDMKLKGIVRFMGVFDTVASIGVPNLDDETKPVSDVIFEDRTISPHVKEALHLVSLDDKRTAFLPTLMNKDKRVTEVWFPGAHSDVGGGFWYDGLSDIALKYLVDEMKKRNLGLNITDPENLNYQRLKAPEGEYQIDLDDVFIKPDHEGKIHQQDRWWPVARATLTVRDVRVNVDDKPTEDHPPTVHYTVLDRIKAIAEYRPKALKGIPHTLTYADGRTSAHKGIIDHIAV